MRHARRIVRHALLFSAAFLLSACAIPSTGVVEAGDPATGIRPILLLHFVKDGKLIAVPRATTEPVGVEQAVAMVVRGPNTPERLSGLTTELPPLTTGWTVRIRGDEVSVELPPDTGPLSRTALDQLLCVSVEAHRIDAPDAETTNVTVTGSRHGRVERSSKVCSAAAIVVPSPSGAPAPASGATRKGSEEIGRRAAGAGK
ncbi:hypothetical protein [Streptomyces sp. NPDC001970]